MRREYDFSKGVRGPVVAAPNQTRLPIALDNEVIEFFQAQALKQGCGYQFLMNSALKTAMLEIREREAAGLPARLRQA
ncbi:BrnA antitoxin family protein [Oxalobacteraceae bacterium A2-2]